MIKLPIGDFELGIGAFRIGDWEFPNPENTNFLFKITNWSFYHQLVISAFNSLIKKVLKLTPFWSLLFFYLIFFFYECVFCHGPYSRLKAMARSPPIQDVTHLSSNERTRTNIYALAFKQEQTCLQDIVTVCNSNRNI